MKILAVNPGSTSTKIAVYEDETPRPAFGGGAFPISPHHRPVRIPQALGAGSAGGQ